MVKATIKDRDTGAVWINEGKYALCIVFDEKSDESALMGGASPIAFARNAGRDLGQLFEEMAGKMAEKRSEDRIKMELALRHEFIRSFFGTGEAPGDQ